MIAGSDRRGTVFGIYELSRQIGVSPWYWWLDVPVKKADALYIKPIYYYSGEPSVKYRGIFLNDEFPSMTAWAKTRFGGMNSDMYAHIYELLLRLRPIVYGLPCGGLSRNIARLCPFSRMIMVILRAIASTRMIR